MSLLKIIYKQNKWLGHSPMKPAKELAEFIFDSKNQTQKHLQESVYFSPKSPHYSIPFWPFRNSNDLGIQEAEIISAHFTTRNYNNLERCYALRIFQQDLDGLDIQLVENPGSTGVKSVDILHRDLETTSKNAFIQLIERVCQGLNRGEDRVRIIGKQDLKEQLQRFLERSDEDVNPKTKRNARKALKINEKPDFRGFRAERLQS